MYKKRKRRRNFAIPVFLCLILIIAIVFTIKFISGNRKTSDKNKQDSSSKSSTSITDTKVSEETLTDQQKKEYVLAHKELYTDELIGFMNKYDQVIDYVYNYPKRESITVSADITDNIVKGTIPLFIQWDNKWGYNKYGESLIGVSGCGPTCLSMVYSGLTGNNDKSPATVAKMSEESGYYVTGVGTSWNLMSKGANQLGLTSKNIALSEGVMAQELQAGHPIICSMKPGDFTYSGHFIVLTGYENGEFTVNDPNSRKNSSKKWTYDILKPQIKNLWAFSK